MKYIVLGLLTIYQKTLSPDHGLLCFRHPYGFCRFYPSCSEYTYQAVYAHGLVVGIALGIARMVTCNPFVRPTIDPVPRAGVANR